MGDQDEPGPRLAQVTVARARASLDTPEMAGLLAVVDPLDRSADEAPGFVWRLPSSHASGLTTRGAPGAPLIVNLSMWTSYEALHAFVYRGPHGRLLTDRSRWVVPAGQASTALWWEEPGRRPDLDYALARLRHLRAFGPSARAFSMRRRFDPDGRRIDPRRHRS